MKTKISFFSSFLEEFENYLKDCGKLSAAKNYPNDIERMYKQPKYNGILEDIVKGSNIQTQLQYCDRMINELEADFQNGYIKKKYRQNLKAAVNALKKFLRDKATHTNPVNSSPVKNSKTTNTQKEQ